MMIKLLFIILMSLLFQACQVSEDVTSSKQTGGISFPGADITAVPPADGWRKLGDTIDVSILFPNPITVTGLPYINAQIGLYTRRLYYYSGNGTGILVFRYTVTSADLDTGGIQFGSEIIRNGGSLTYAPNSATVADLPLDFSLPESMVKVDGVVPTLSQITAPTGGNYATGQLLKYQLGFSEKVYVSGTPSFQVNLTSGSVAALYRNGSGSTTLQFARLLQATDDDSDGFANGTTLNLNSSSGITITDEAGNSVSTSIISTVSSNVLINVIEPTIASIAAPIGTTYTAGQNLDFTVTMSEAVTITGQPSIPIQLTTGIVLAKYLSGSGTTSLTFRYTVLANHVDMNGIELVSPMILNGGTIRNIADTQNAALIFSPPVTTAILVDAATGPYVTFSIAASPDIYLEGENIDFTLHFNRAVTTAVTPRLPIIVGGTTVYANCISPVATPTTSLVFRYTPLTTHEDLDGISLTGPIDLSIGGSSIVDSNGKNAILSYVHPSTTGILVDGTSPTITNISTAVTDNLNLGDKLDIDVQFSEPVIVSGAPLLSITIGTTTYNSVGMISGEGTNTLRFRHTVASGDIDQDGVDVNSLVAGGTIKDARGHNANLTFGVQNLAGFVIDAEKSNILAFTAHPDGLYNIGDNIDFVVDWSEPTYASGSPKIPLTVGVNTYYAVYEPSLSNPLQFTFRWTVTAPASAPGGISMSSITGGSIQDEYGNTADVSMLIPNISGIIIDGVVPKITGVSRPADGIYKAGQNLTFVLTWSEAVNLNGTPHLNLVIGQSTVPAPCVATTATTTTCTYTVLTGDLDNNGITLQMGVFLDPLESIRDIPGNDAYLQIATSATTFAPLSSDLSNVKVDAVAPTVLAIVPPPNETYKYTENMDFTVMWSEPVTISGSPRIALTLDTAPAAPTYLTYVAAASTPTTSVFRYTVALGDEDTDGVQIVSPIDLFGGTIRDAATNDATLSFIVPTMSGVLVDGIKAVITGLMSPPTDTYGIGANVDFKIIWSESVDVNTTGGTPYVRICVTSSLYCLSYKNAEYVAGSGTNTLTFRYTVDAGDSDSNGVKIVSPVYTNGGSIVDSNAGNPVYLTFTAATYANVKVDGIAPTISTATSVNVSAATRPNYFKPGQVIQYNLTFNEVVQVTGTPRIVMSIGGTTRYATLFSGDNSNLLSFRMTIDASDALLDLDGISINSMIDLNGGTIEDNAGNAHTGTIPFSEKDYVYYTNTVARYHFDGADYTSSTCYGTSQCINNVYDITGNGHTLSKVGTNGPQVLSGFGGNSTMYAQFNASSLLKLTSDISVKHAIIVMKTVSNPSTTTTPSYHTLLTRRPYWYSSSTNASVRFSSTNAAKGISFSPSMKLKTNDGALAPAYVSSESAPSLWVGNTNYIYTFELSSASTFYTNNSYSTNYSYFGGSSFNGQIAEIILISGSTAQTEAQIDRIVDQLNTIHDVY